MQRQPAANGSRFQSCCQETGCGLKSINANGVIQGGPVHGDVALATSHSVKVKWELLGIISLTVHLQGHQAKPSQRLN